MSPEPPCSRKAHPTSGSANERDSSRPGLADLFAGAADKEERNRRIDGAVRVHRCSLAEVGDHVALLHSTINMIAGQQHRALKRSER